MEVHILGRLGIRSICDLWMKVKILRWNMRVLNDWNKRDTLKSLVREFKWKIVILREASLTRGNMVKRWKKKDGFSEVFCSRNYNKYGRYISLINVKDKRREVIIIPKLNFNSGWLSFAEKEYNEVLKRSLVGAFEPRAGETKDRVEIFALRVTTEQVIEGDWEWRNNPVILQWWNPTIGTRCRRSKENSTWVKIVGLPLHFWDQKIFKVIGDFYGGWVETEEETQLRNHLKWARIRIKGDGADIPKEVTIDGGRICYTMQIWAELSVRVFVGEDPNSEVSTQRSRGGKPLGKGEDPLQSQKVTAIAGRAHVVTEACGQSSKSNEIVGRGEPNSKQSPILRLGPDQNKEGGLVNKKIDLARDKQGESLEGLSGIKELATQFLQAYNKWETSSMVENTDISAHKNRESVNKTNEVVELLYNKAKGIDHSKDFGESSGVQELVEGGMQIQQIHDAEPFSIQNPGYHTDGKIEASSKKECDGKKGQAKVSTPRHEELARMKLKNLRGINKISARNLVKSSFLKWRADVYCLQETKINKDVEGIAKQLWSSRWMKCGYSEADGSSGGILIMWDSRVWMGSCVEEGKYSITYKFEAVHDGFCWFLTGVDAPHTKAEKLECWEEIAQLGSYVEVPVTGDFNTAVENNGERRGSCRRIANVMADFELDKGYGVT
ncbi:hypothetical protein H5410_060333 [Solanum commersonii]|uniref:DUF4283 domain-containing protein n=1 Tax=Solanum commersonii TaxID=4109 RepID=A0A9J5W5C1_SOLCO|nr:hypothetical protein H5410_060333 [Solanum commersonii]